MKMLERNHLIRQWSDHKILPGQNISERIRKEMSDADIVVFLISSDFIYSEECIKEWHLAKKLVAESDKPIVRIPIILRESAWKDLLKEDDLKALPDDGKPVASYTDYDKAWQEVYEGTKRVILDLLTTFIPRAGFISDLNETEFLSQQYIQLKDLFIFPRMTCNERIVTDQKIEETTISTTEQVFGFDRVLIHGQERSGKTSLGKYLCMSLIEQSEPVLFVDVAQNGIRGNEVFLEETYNREFSGDYSLWKRQENKTLIVDNFIHTKPALDLVELAESMFDKIVVLTSSDVYYAFFLDEHRMADFKAMFIEPLSRAQQEELIRRRLALLETGQTVTDGLVDRVESQVNSIIIANNIVPRYPFYVLSILQTYEAYMPTNMNITSYGHCYYVLITANLLRSGISNTDDSINACFNFAEQLAYAIYSRRELQKSESFDFQNFKVEYQKRFYIEKATINRLQEGNYGIIREDGSFRSSYMYYFFLGKFLANNNNIARPIIEEMCEHSHNEANHLTLLFTIHHAHSNSIIDDILLGTMCALDDVLPATLTREETKRFDNLVRQLPESILSEDTVDEQRRKLRVLDEDVLENPVTLKEDGGEPEDIEPVNAIFRIMRNNKVMGQILRNRYGNLEKDQIADIVEIIAESGLRLVRLLLDDEEEMAEYARYIKSRNPEWKLSRIKDALNWLSFVWAMVNIEQIVTAINVPEIRESVEAMVEKKNLPAYDLIGYFSQLDRAEQITKRERDRLADLWNGHRDIFIRRVLSMRTQHYMNTHRSAARQEQSVCAVLEIKYTPRTRKE